MNTEIMDVKEVAEYLKLSAKKIYQLIEDREIPFKKIGGQYRFVKADIDNWMSKSGSGNTLREDKEDYNSPGINSLLEKAKAVSDKLKKGLFIVGILTRELKKYGLKPVVVGGFAVEFYTTGGYNTGDIDLVFPDNKLLGGILVKLGFEKAGRHWISKELDLYIEAPGSRLKEGESGNIVEVNIGGLNVYLIGIEDLIIDRLNAFVHWKSTDEKRWIKELMFINYDKINWQYLNGRSKKEKVYPALKDLKTEVENKTLIT